MTRPPRKPNEPLIGRLLLWRIVYVSVLMALGTFGLFYYELAAGSSLPVARAVAVNAIVFFEIFYLFNSRHLTGSVLNRDGLFGNPIALWGITTVVLLQVGFTYWPIMHSLFHIGPLEIAMWLRIVGAGLMLLLVVEAEKAVTRTFCRTTIPVDGR